MIPNGAERPAPLSPMMEMLLYVQMRRREEDVEGLLEREIAAEQRRLQENVDALRERLLSKQQRAHQMGQNLADEVAAVPFLAGAEEQLDHIATTHEPFDRIHGVLQEKNGLAERELAQKRSATVALQNELQLLQGKLKNAPGKYQETETKLLELGCRINHYTADNQKG